MKINKRNALRLWEEIYGTDRYLVRDFCGNMMWKDAYADRDYFIPIRDLHYRLMYLKHSCRDDEVFNHIHFNRCCIGREFGERIYCGWNIHHILPRANGGTNEKSNLICTNIETNEQAKNKTTFWIDNSLYQVRDVNGNHEICCVRK